MQPWGCLDSGLHNRFLNLPPHPQPFSHVSLRKLLPVDGNETYGPKSLNNMSSSPRTSLNPASGLHQGQFLDYVAHSLGLHTSRSHRVPFLYSALSILRDGSGNIPTLRSACSVRSPHPSSVQSPVVFPYFISVPLLLKRVLIASFGASLSPTVRPGSMGGIDLGP